MSVADFTLPRATVNAKLLSLAAAASVFLAVFLSGFVLWEPAPYELLLAVVMPLWVLAGLRVSRTVAPMFALLVLLNIGGLVSMSQMAELRDTPLYLSVTLFLSLTAIFFAAALESRPDLFRVVVAAWLCAAVSTAFFGILGYFDAFPGASAFTKYDRAAGVFKDPNVFGPFLVFPAIWLTYRIMTGRLQQAALLALPLSILLVGMFLSFSRGAWGLFVFSAALLVLCVLIRNPNGLFRVRILVMGVVLACAFGLGLVVALQIPEIADLFTQRARLVQDYDGDRLGRFARHLIGFQLAMEHPLGIGPLVFGLLYGEDTHNIWLKTLLDYSWLGFGAYLTLIVWTLAGGFRILFRDRPWQPVLMCAYVVFLGHVLLGALIDTNHWRHFYVLMAVIWAAMALEARAPYGARSRQEDGPSIRVTDRLN